MTEWQARLSEAGLAVQELPDGLTPREVEVLRLVADDQTNKQIASVGPLA